MRYGIITGIAVAIDLLSKKVICETVPLQQKKMVWKNRFYIWHIKNKGAAYNSFAAYMPYIKGISVMGMVYIIKQIRRYGKEQKVLGSSGAVLLGGALGNFIERMTKGSVTDFLFVKGKKAPIFNIADCCIALGGSVFLLSMVFQKEK